MFIEVMPELDDKGFSLELRQELKLGSSSFLEVSTIKSMGSVDEDDCSGANGNDGSPSVEGVCEKEADGGEKELGSPKPRKRASSVARVLSEQEEAVRRHSSHGHLSGWGMDGFIAKSNDDLRQEIFVMQVSLEVFRGV